MSGSKKILLWLQRGTIHKTIFISTMENKILKVIGFWAMGLILFISTMIVIRWTIDFVTWSALDSGWAQVIGSIAALAVAIFIMSRQNKHSRELLLDSDRRALRRRASAVSAIAERAMIMAAKMQAKASSTPRENEDLTSLRSGLGGARMAFVMMMSKIDAIPLHELGSYDMAEGLQLMHGNLDVLDKIYERILSGQQPWGTPRTVALIDKSMRQLEDAYKKFARGVADVG